MRKDSGVRMGGIYPPDHFVAPGPVPVGQCVEPLFPERGNLKGAGREGIAGPVLELSPGVPGRSQLEPGPRHCSNQSNSFHVSLWPNPPQPVTIRTQASSLSWHPPHHAQPQPDLPTPGRLTFPSS